LADVLLLFRPKLIQIGFQGVHHFGSESGENPRGGTKARR
jgi:hypothetical protein